MLSITIYHKVSSLDKCWIVKLCRRAQYYTSSVLLHTHITIILSTSQFDFTICWYPRKIIEGTLNLSQSISIDFRFVSSYNCRMLIVLYCFINYARLNRFQVPFALVFLQWPIRQLIATTVWQTVLSCTAMLFNVLSVTVFFSKPIII